MAVAAAIGVSAAPSNDNAVAIAATANIPAANHLRNLSNKTSARSSSKSLIVPNTQARTGGSSVSPLGDINRSIEKMSLEGDRKPETKPVEPKMTSSNYDSVRRDSNWTTTSTEGYGSMRSGSDLGSAVGSSRRTSDISMTTQVTNHPRKTSGVFSLF